MGADRRTGAAAPSQSSAKRTNHGVAYVLLRPVLVIAFALLHIVYQAVLLTRQTSLAIKNAFQRHPLQPPASFTNLADLLSAHRQPRESVRIPKHFAVILADAAPSSIRLYLSTLFLRLRSQEPTPKRRDLWHRFKCEFEAAVEAKRVSDVAAMVHLARISGVQQLTVYSSEALSKAALQELDRTLHLSYKTKAVFPQDEAEKEMPGEADEGRIRTWSRYAGLRKRTSAAKGSNSSTPSSPGSPASSDSEAGPSSLDETLASSYTAENEARDATDATVNIRVGLESFAQKDRPALGCDASLQVTLLSRHDGQDRLCNMVGSYVAQRASIYLSSMLVPDMTAFESSRKRFSASALRKSWIARRQSFTSELTVSELDRTLLEAGYMDEPDLLVVFGQRARVRKLYGFPAWPLRVTDLFYDDENSGKRPYGSRDFVAALRKLGKMEQRYGR